MSRNTVRPLTPVSAKRSGILLILLAVLFITSSTVTAVRSRSVKLRSTEKAMGTVVSVDSRHIHSRFSGYYEEYKAVIEFTANDKTGAFDSEWTKGRLYEGKEMLIYFDPDDLSVGYAEDIPPENGADGFLFGFLPAALGVYYLRRSKSMTMADHYTDEKQSTEL